MLAVVLLSGALVAAALIGADRLLAAAAGRRAARRLAVVLGAGAGAAPVVRITGVPFVSQLAAGLYREVEVTAAAWTAGGIEFGDLTARLSRVRAPLRTLLAGEPIVAGRATAVATIPLAALAARLPPGLALRRHGSQLRISGRALLTPVSGTLAVTADGQRICVAPKVLGVPSLVGFAIALSGLPAELSIATLRITDAGLEVTVTGSEVKLAPS